MIEQKRAESRSLLLDITEIKEEKRTISGSFDTEGGPLKRIQILKNNIARMRDELKVLYRRIGTEAASINGAGRREIIDSFILSEDRETLDSAAQTSQSIQDDDAAIKRLQASLDIDDEKEKIEKYRKMIQEKRMKIAQAEKSITEFEDDIRVSESNIEKLQKLL
jgi:ribonucleotide reductase alpha subunit